MRPLISILICLFISLVVRIATSSYDNPSLPRPYRIAGAAPRTAQDHILFGLPLDINAADAETYEALPGIGPSLAARIVHYREEHGRFRSVDDLQGVSGIGPKLLARIGPWLGVDDTSSP